MRFKKGNLLFYLQVSLCLFLVLSEIPQSFAKKGKGIKGKGKGIKGGKGIKAGKGIKGKSAVAADGGDATSEAPLDTTTLSETPPDVTDGPPADGADAPADVTEPTPPPSEGSEAPPDVTEAPPAPEGEAEPTTAIPVELHMEITLSPGGGEGGGGGSAGTQGGDSGPDGATCETDQNCNGLKGLYCEESSGLCKCRQGVWVPADDKCSSAEGPMFAGGGTEEGLTDPGRSGGNAGGAAADGGLAPLGVAIPDLSDGSAIKGDHCEDEKRCKVEAWLHCKIAQESVSHFHQCECVPGTKWEYEKQECKRTGLPGHRGLALVDEECDSNLDCDIDRGLFCNPLHHICVCKPNQQWSHDNNICYATGGMAAFASEFEDIPNAPGLYSGPCSGNRHCDTKRGLYCSLAVGQCRCKHGIYNENVHKCEKDKYENQGQGQGQGQSRMDAQLQPYPGLARGQGDAHLQPYPGLARGQGDIQLQPYPGLARGDAHLQPYPQY